MAKFGRALPRYDPWRGSCRGRDDEDAFPDDTKAPIRASGTTSWGARFSIALDMARPPSISRLYAQLPEPGFLPRRKFRPLAILATHYHLALISVGTETPEGRLVQDLFVYRADKDPASSWIKALPACTQPDFDYHRRDGRLPRRRRRRRSPSSAPTSRPRLLRERCLGLRCRSGDDEFVVAELGLCRFSQSKVFADICFLRSSCSSAGDGDQLGGTWHSKRVDILCRDKPGEVVDLLTQRLRILCRDNPGRDEGEIMDILFSGKVEPSDVLDMRNDPALDLRCIDNDAWQLYCWQTEIIIPCGRWLCLADFHRGILFCDVSSKDDEDPSPTVSFLRFPLDEFPLYQTSMSVFPYRGVSVVDDGRALKFIDVARDDGIDYGALKRGASFTITCHTLELSGGDSMAWNTAADYKVTSGELWNGKYPGCLPRDILMYPQVDIDRPSVVHFLLKEFGHVDKKLWVVSVDISKKVVGSYSLFIDVNEGLETEDAYWIKEKFMEPTRFLPCELLNFSSKRKHMG